MALVVVTNRIPAAGLAALRAERFPAAIPGRTSSLCAWIRVAPLLWSNPVR